MTETSRGVSTGTGGLSSFPPYPYLHSSSPFSTLTSGDYFLPTIPDNSGEEEEVMSASSFSPLGEGTDEWERNFTLWELNATTSSTPSMNDFLPTMLPPTGPTPPDCSSPIDFDYDLLTSLISLALFGFGLFFCIFGYRCFKSVLFLTGFSFGLVIVFLICQVEDLLPQYGNVGIATLAGFLYGLICLLVPYVGFFTLGFHAGLLAGLASMLWLPTGHSVWISVIFLLGTGLIGAIANVCLPSLSVVTTSLIGGAGIAISFDYFVEKFRMAAWMGQLVKEEGTSFCWFSWLLLCLWPCLLVVGVVVQMTLTARDFSVQIYGYHETKRNPPRRRLTREERALARQAKYRYLYQVRTAGGDYISQAYMQFLRNKQQPHGDTLSTHMSTLPTSTQEESMAGN